MSAHGVTIAQPIQSVCTPRHMPVGGSSTGDSGGSGGRSGGLSTGMPIAVPVFPLPAKRPLEPALEHVDTLLERLWHQSEGINEVKLCEEIVNAGDFEKLVHFLAAKLSQGHQNRPLHLLEVSLQSHPAATRELVGKIETFSDALLKGLILPAIIPVLPTLLGMLETFPDVAVKCKAVRAIGMVCQNKDSRGMVCQNEASQKAVLDAGGIPKLLDVLDNPDIQETALDALVDVVRSHKDNQDAIAQHDGMDKLISLLQAVRPCKDASLSSPAKLISLAKLIAAVVCNHHGNSAAFQHSGGVTLLMDAITKVSSSSSSLDALKGPFINVSAEAGTADPSSFELKC